MIELRHMIEDVLTPGAPLSRAGVIGGAICTVWAAGAAAWVGRALLRRRRARAAFLGAARARGFTAEEGRRLWDLGRFATDRARILESVEVFDQCVFDLRISAETAGRPVPESGAEFYASALRRKYAPARHAPLAISDTQHLEANQPVKVRLRDGTMFNAFVVDSTPERLSLTLPAASRTARLDQRKSVHVTFWRPLDARYEFETEVVAGPARSALTVAHAPVKRFQDRESVRVRSRDEVRLAYIDAEQAGSVEGGPAPELTATGTLRDLSIGGACVVTSARPPADAWVLLRLTLKRAPHMLLLPARIIRRQALDGTSNPMVQLSVKFEPLSARNEHQLGRLVAEIQQRLIRRMLVRAGEEEAVETPVQGATPIQKPVWVRHNAPVSAPVAPERPAETPVPANRE